MIIIQDTREKKPWKWVGVDVIKKSLETGDYSVIGYEDLICIERKRCTTEIATNLGKEWARFEREFKRMQGFCSKTIICEFTIDEMLDFPKNIKLPPWQKSKIRMTGKFMYKRLLEEAEKYDIDVLFCPNSGEAKLQAIQIIRKAIYDIREETGYDPPQEI